MGCGNSSPKPPSGQEEEKKSAPLTFGRDPKFEARKHEFIVKDKNGETITRAPGKIEGQQFMIADCTDCTILLFDNNAAITIDDCKNCRILIGPCASSCFIRDCTDCVLIAAVQQLRTRDCRRIQTLLYSGTAPVIESSKDMTFGCYRFGYPDLAAQFGRAELSIWNNKWSEIFDFTAKSDSTHYSFMKQHVDPCQLLQLSPEQIAEYQIDLSNCVVPVSVGVGVAPPRGETCVLVLGPGQEAAAQAMLAPIAKANGLHIIKSREFVLDKALLKRMWKVCGMKNPPKNPSRCIGIQFRGPGAGNIVRGIASSVTPALTAGMWMCPDDDDVMEELKRFFFVDTEENTGHRLG